jgi:hypothetical protein
MGGGTQLPAKVGWAYFPEGYCIRPYRPAIEKAMTALALEIGKQKPQV